MLIIFFVVLLLVAKSNQSLYVYRNKDSNCRELEKCLAANGTSINDILNKIAYFVKAIL